MNSVDKRYVIISHPKNLMVEGIISVLSEIIPSNHIYTSTSFKDLLLKTSLYHNAVIIVDPYHMEADKIADLITSAGDSALLLLTDHCDSEATDRLTELKKLSIIGSDCSKDDFIYAFDKVARGERFLDQRIIEKILSGKSGSADENEDLTKTEKLILKEIALGKTTKAIAFEKNLSFHTVNTHRRNIFRKIDVNNLSDATKYALKMGLIDISEYYI